MALKFVLNHQLFFVMALLYVLLDLINEVSSGTVTMAKKLLKKLLELCNSPLKEEDKASLGTLQEKSFHLVSRHLVKEVISPNENVRKEVGMGISRGRSGGGVWRLVSPVVTAIPYDVHVGVVV